MRIVNIIQRYSPAIGGAEMWCQGMCRYLSGQGHNVRILTFDVYNEDEYWQEPCVDDCRVRLGRIDYDKDIFIRRYKRSKIHPLAFYFFKHILHKYLKLYFYGPHSVEMYLKMFREIMSADIVHLHTIPYPHNFIAYKIARLFNKNIVITPHFHPGHPYYELKTNYLLMKNCDAIFTVTDYEKEYFINKGLDKNKIFVTYNAINPHEYDSKNLAEFRKNLFKRYNMDSNTKIIVFIGRKIEYKGVDILIEAVKRINNEANLRLFLIGPDFPWFNEYYSKLSAHDKGKIIDMDVITEEEKINILHLADLLVLPSKHEAFGIVFLEAWICGTPVIGANNGVMPILLKDSGLISEYGDINGLKEKIEVLLNNKEMSEKMALNGKNKVLNNYTWDKVGNRILNVYNNLIR